MKSKFFRFVAVCFLLLFGLTTFQSSALAGPRGDDGDSRVESPRVAVRKPHEGGGGGGGGGAGWRFPDIFSRPKPGRIPGPQLDEIAEKALRDRADRGVGAGGRDTGQRERNRESGHKGFGGPQ